MACSGYFYPRFSLNESICLLQRTDFPTPGYIWAPPGSRPVCPCRITSWKRSRFYRWVCSMDTFAGHVRKSANATAGCVTGFVVRPQVLLDECLQAGQVREAGFPVTVKAPFHPGFFITAFSVSLPKSQSLCYLGADAVVTFTLPGGSTSLGCKRTSSPYFQPSSTPQVSNWVQAGKTISANLAVGVRKLSCTTINSTFDSSFNIAAERLTSACWLIRQLVATA